MWGLSNQLVLYYGLFSTFLFYQQYHERTFQGASQSLRTALRASITFWFVAGLGFLVVYAFVRTLWGGVKLFLIGLLFVLVFSVAERAITRSQFFGVVLSALGFVGLPICFVLMIRAV